MKRERKEEKPLRTQTLILMHLISLRKYQWDKPYETSKYLYKWLEWAESATQRQRCTHSSCMSNTCIRHIKNNEDSFGLQPKQFFFYNYCLSFDPNNHSLSLLPHFYFIFLLAYSLSSFLLQLLLFFFFPINRVSIMHTLKYFFTALPTHNIFLWSIDIFSISIDFF